MARLQEYLVSSSGQMSLPAEVRHRWDLDRGGPVDVLDLGFGVLTLPRGEGRHLLSELLSRDEHAAFVEALRGDPDQPRDDVTVVLDDHLLRDLLADEVGDGLAEIIADHEPATTNLYYLRLCKSRMSAEADSWSGPGRPNDGWRSATRSSSFRSPSPSFRSERSASAWPRWPRRSRVSTLGAEAVAAAEHLDARALRLGRRRRTRHP